MSTMQEPLSIDVFSELLDTVEPYRVDESFTYETTIAIQPSSQHNLNVGGPIVFQSMYQDGYFLPAESSITIQGRLVKEDGTVYDNNDEVSLVNNAMLYLFKEAKYHISDKEIESVLDPGQTSSLFAYLTLPDDFSTSAGLSRCWSKDTTNHPDSRKYRASRRVANVGAGLAVPEIAEGFFTPSENPNYNQGFATRKSFLFSSNPKGTFEFTIPFSHIFGFSEYKRIVYGVQQRITLDRTNNDLAIHRADGTPPGKVELTNITWYIPKYQLSTAAEVVMSDRSVAKIQLPVYFSARTSRSVNIPTGTTSFEWPLSVSSGLEKPRWVIVGLQTGRRSQTETPAVFDTCGLTQGYLTLNGVRYPGTDVIVDFDRHQYSRLYKMFDEFKKIAYRYDELAGGTQVNFSAFNSLFPILVFKVMAQSEVFKTGVIDMRITLKTAATPANTTAYALIISDRVFKLGSDGKKISELVN